MPTSQNRAREILGRNFLGIEVATKHFDAAFTSETPVALASVPFSESTLEECKTTHLLVAGFPMTVLDVRANTTRGSKAFDSYAYGEIWFNTERFATTEKVNLGWYLLRKEVVSGSVERSFWQQQTMLSPKEEVPRACELVYALVLYFLALTQGRHLLLDCAARCIDLDSLGRRVWVGSDSGGIFIYSCDEGPKERTGVAAIRKIN